MTRWVVLLAPILSLLAVDPAAFDYHAVKALPLLAGGLLCAAAASGSTSSASVALLVFLGARLLMRVRADDPGAARAWWVLLALAALHHAPLKRMELTRRAVPALAALGVAAAVCAVGQRLLG
ncbi:MAG: hypothetical protein ACREID_01160, partial [Planctomycetota bacterium]